MRIKIPQLSYTASFVTLIVLFLALVIINNQAFQGIRFDLTENKLYTLSDGTINILSKIQNPIALHLYFSEDSSQSYPQLKNYYERVKDMLEEYRQHANEKLTIHYVKPEAFSEEEDQAAQLGLQNVRLSGGDSLYFGIVGTNILDNVETIPFLQNDKEVFLEYELSKLIYSLTHLDKPVLGLMTSLPMYPTKIDTTTGKMNEPWFITQQLEQLFDVRLVHTDVKKIDHEIDVLMLVHPKLLGEKAFYAIDQFIMRGGKGLFFVDSFSNKEEIPTAADSPLPDKYAKSSSLNRLFEKWGFTVDQDHVVGSPNHALPVSLGNGETAKHLAMMNFVPQNFNQEDVVMNGLKSLNLGTSSYITLNDGAKDKGVELEYLIRTHKNADLISLDLMRYLPHPDHLRKNYKSDDTSYVVAARIHGQFTSSFDQPPKNTDADEDSEVIDKKITKTNDDSEVSAANHLSETVEQGNLVVIADTDLLADHMWASTQNFFGRRIVQPFANNRDFVVNLVDNLFGNSDLIGIRSRSSFARPFTKVQNIEANADRKFRATEENLKKEYEKVNQRLKELQEQRTDKKNVLLTQEQKDEIRAVEEKKLEVRKKLRSVRHQQVKDIEELGTYLKIINIGVVPSVVTIIALLAAMIKLRRRRQNTSA